MKVTVKNKQSLMDITVENYGQIDNLVSVSNDNDISISDVLETNQELTVNSENAGDQEIKDKITTQGLSFNNNVINLLPAINGYLYNWYALSNANFAPSEWKAPTVSEYATLTTSLGGTTVAGAKLKETGLTYWNTPNTGADNSSGFTLYGSGYRDGGDGQFYQIKVRAYMGTTDDLTTVMASVRAFFNTITTVNVNLERGSGASVRLLYTGSGTPSSVTDYDGNVYDVVLIGSQYWTKQNWKCTKLNNGTPLTKVTDTTEWINKTSEAYCAYDNDKNNV